MAIPPRAAAWPAPRRSASAGAEPSSSGAGQYAASPPIRSPRQSCPISASRSDTPQEHQAQNRTTTGMNSKKDLTLLRHGAVIETPPLRGTAVIRFRNTLFKRYVNLRPSLFVNVKENVDESYRNGA